MKRASIIIGFSIFLLLAASAASAIQTGPVRGARIGILETPQRSSYGVDGAVQRALPRYLQYELQRAGYSTRLVRRTLDELRDSETTGDDFYVEVAYGNADGGPIIEIGTGDVIGSTGVGAEVSVVAASVDAEVRIYDARTLDLVNSFVLRSSNVSPVLSGVSLGGYHGFLAFEIPFFRNEPFRRAARDIAHQAVSRIAGDAGRDER